MPRHRTIPLVVAYTAETKPLSERERAVADLVLRGLNYKHVAERLGISSAAVAKIAIRPHVARFVAESLAALEAEETKAKAKADAAWEAGYRAAMKGARTPEEVRARSDAYSPQPLSTDFDAERREEADRAFVELLR